MNHARLIVVVGATVALGIGAVNVVLARSIAAPSSVEVAACQGALTTAREYGPIESVSGAFASTAGQIAIWQETRDGPSGPHFTSFLRGLPPGQPLFVCYYDGTFSTFPGPPLPNGQPRQYGRIVLIVDQAGRATFDRVGPRDVLTITSPAVP